MFSVGIKKLFLLHLILSPVFSPCRCVVNYGSVLFSNRVFVPFFEDFFTVHNDV